MKFFRFTFITCLMSLVSLSLEGYASDGGAAPVVMELFTSQNCSSCPPADKLLGEIVQKTGIIALGCHVTYWDRSSWKDTLSLPACTERQKAYAQAAGRQETFTPEVIINGRSSLIGSDKNAISSTLQNIITPLASLTVKAADNGGYIVTLPDAFVSIAPLTLVIAVYGPDTVQPIGKGENGGLSVRYVHPVIALSTLKLSGEPSVRIEALPTNAVGFAALLHEGATSSSPLIAAGRYDSLR